MSLDNEHENETDTAKDQQPANETVLSKVGHSKVGKTALNVATALTIGGPIVASMESCQKTNDLPPKIEYVTPTFNTQFFAGRMGVFYNTTASAVTQGGTQQQLIDSLKKYQYVAVQPALISPQEAINNNINAFAYGSGISLVPPGTTSGPRYNQLYAAIQAVDGFLKDASGNPLFDPTIGNAPPAPFMVDLRKPQVYNLMRDYLVEIGKAYPKGLFFDSQDAATFVENNDPARYAGITQKMLDLMAEVGTKVTDYDAQGHVVTGHGVVVGGGLIKSNVLPGEAIFDTMAKVNCVIWEESQYGLNGFPRSQTDHDWTKGRFIEYGKAIKRAVEADPLKPNAMGIFALEDFRDHPNMPADFAHRKAYAQDVANFYRDISNAVKTATIGPKTPNGVPMLVSIYTADFGFDKKFDIDENLKLKGLISKLEPQKRDMSAEEFQQHMRKHQEENAPVVAMLDDIKNQKPEDKAFAAVNNGAKPVTRSLKDQMEHMGMLDEQGRDISKSPYIS